MIRKPWKMWAIVNDNGTLECWDERAPIYWYQHMAKRDRGEYCSYGNTKVIRVEIREIREVRRKAK